jgi:membrane protein
LTSATASTVDSRTLPLPTDAAREMTVPPESATGSALPPEPPEPAVSAEPSAEGGPRGQKLKPAAYPRWAMADQKLAATSPALVVPSWRLPWSVVRLAIEGWFDDRCGSQAAALAFFALFSLAPMLVLVVAVAGYVVDASLLPDRIFSELSNVVGAGAAAAVRATVAQAHLSQWSSQATIASIVVTLVGATATFAELKAALNVILKCQTSAAPTAPAFSKVTWAFVKARLLSAALVMGLGFMLIATLAFDALLALLGAPIASVVTWLRLDLLVTAALLALAFTVLLAVLPDAPIAWRDALWGGVVAAVMFTLGKYGFAYYLAAAGTANAFGAAGSVAVTLMWLYYSAAVFFFGAQIVRARQSVERA